MLKRRLARAHQLLREPQSFDQPISAVAFAAGFGHLSRFNRAFRSRFGQTPSDVRVQAQREDWVVANTIQAPPDRIEASPFACAARHRVSRAPRQPPVALL